MARILVAGIAQQAQKASIHLVWRCEFALPDHDHLPTHFSESFRVLMIAGYISVELWLPEICVGFRSRAIPALLMAMPETSVHEDDCSPFRQYDVWFSGKIFAVKAESKASPMKNRPDLDLGRRVSPLDAAHVPTSSDLIKSIHMN